MNQTTRVCESNSIPENVISVAEILSLRTDRIIWVHNAKNHYLFKLFISKKYNYVGCAIGADWFPSS